MKWLGQKRAVHKWKDSPPNIWKVYLTCFSLTGARLLLWTIANSFIPCFICTSQHPHGHLAISSTVDSFFKRNSWNPISLPFPFLFIAAYYLKGVISDYVSNILSKHHWIQRGGLWCMGLFRVKVALLSSYLVTEQSDTAAPTREGKIPNWPGRGGLLTSGRCFF